MLEDKKDHSSHVFSQVFTSYVLVSQLRMLCAVICSYSKITHSPTHHHSNTLHQAPTAYACCLYHIMTYHIHHLTIYRIWVCIKLHLFHQFHHPHFLWHGTWHNQWRQVKTIFLFLEFLLNICPLFVVVSSLLCCYALQWSDWRTGTYGDQTHLWICLSIYWKVTGSGAWPRFSYRGSKMSIKWTLSEWFCLTMTKEVSLLWS